MQTICKPWVLHQRFDNDVWIQPSPRSNKDYNYVATHVDNFKIVAKDPDSIMASLEHKYMIKDDGLPKYYLGNNYCPQKGKWMVGCKKYVVKAVHQVEAMFPTLTRNATPMWANNHPENDNLPLLGDSNHRKFQMLIGMLNWAVTIGWFDVAYAMSSLSCFSACPREGHLKRALHIFGYLKRHPN